MEHPKRETEAKTQAMSEEEPRTFAEHQLANARVDPRRRRGEEAMVADWREGVEALERVRGFSIFSILELHRALDSRDLRPTDESHLAQVMWQRRELAKAEIANDFAELNAMTLVGLVGALDALVESLAPRAREMQVALEISERLDELRQDQPQTFAKVQDDELAKVREAAVKVMTEQLDEIRQARGGGAERWEEVLRHAGLQAPEDRPIPEDMDLALREIVALRHVLVHNAARMDERALQRAPSLPYALGELVRIGCENYRHYSAAIHTFGDEVVWRLLRGVGLAPFDMNQWRENYPIGA